MRQKSILENKISSYEKLELSFTDIVELIEIAENESEDQMLIEAEKELAGLASHIKTLEIECLFSGEADSNDCFLEIHAGAGGTESHDWALMLFRMYLRFAERHKFKTEIVNELDGEEAGIKSATIRMSGINSYGWLKTESGVHRLVRMSPFNAAGKRQTSFASVWVYPQVDDTIEIEINDKDLRIDTYRASGAGGQHVNKTDSAVRITHLPTGIVVASQNDRSQHKNKAEAFSMLRSRLYEMQLSQRQAEIDAANASKTDNGWGHQIRSYVLQPYQMVKDMRSDYETSDTTGVLDGKIDEFIMATLAKLVVKDS
ncbi:Peptide chain release factor 2 [Candidatus Arcanobacter lacustris]|uniref:Peptide chain release factor 2 n=1 Tax=Candidatus Arcanibacter lacustris TaxID=1607817 RepID=A0A0F5MPD5_9RICK|nr:Peptide chain release factor 2 [Candidatus Arcanobacter lacustris]